MNIDRKLQNCVLQFLKMSYDNFLEDRFIYAACIDGIGIPEFEDYGAQLAFYSSIKIDKTTIKHLRENLTYLTAHELLEKKGSSYRITHKGIDFIEDDGGLSAILNISTIKLHPSTLDLITAAIDGSSLNPSDKQKMIDQLKSLPADAIKQILTELVNKGVGYLPALFASLYT